MAEGRADEVHTSLHELAELREHRFTSRAPMIGGLIAAFRAAWNNISTRWYVGSVMRQQSQFNRLAADELVRLQEWLIRQDREQAQLRHDLGELQLLVARLLREREAGGPRPALPGMTEAGDPPA